MARGQSRRDQLNYFRKRPQRTKAKLPLSDMAAAIREGKVVPIIGYAVHRDNIVDYMLGLASHAEPEPDQNDETMTDIEALDDGVAAFDPPREQTVSQLWADHVQYPFGDFEEVSRVAQYRHTEIMTRLTREAYDSQADVETRPAEDVADEGNGAGALHRFAADPVDADDGKEAYLQFSKWFLLRAAEADPELEETVKELRTWAKTATISEIIRELDFPLYETSDDDPLRLLARFNTVPLYITTSYYDFMEQALKAEGRKPQTQVCFWRAPSRPVPKEFWPADGFEATPERPVVYHLYGYEKFPATLVLTEDDYLDFLIKVSEPPTNERPIIPSYIRDALASRTLLLLGYWFNSNEFRTLFRGLIRPEGSSRRRNLLVHLMPSAAHGDDQVARAKDYLENYFSPRSFRILWDDPDKIVKKLWRAWEAQRPK